jgi:hypothetical protein
VAPQSFFELAKLGGDATPCFGGTSQGSRIARQSRRIAEALDICQDSPHLPQERVHISSKLV